MAQNIVSFIQSKDALHKHYERLADFENDFRNANLVELVASSLHGKRVLDLGCGSGYLLQKLAERGIEAAGIEPNQETIALAKERNPMLTIHQGFAEDAGAFVKERVDAIVMMDVLEHVEDDRQLLENLRPLLRSGGELLIVVPAYAWLYGKRDRKYGHHRRYSKKMLSELFEETGFRSISFRYWNAIGFLPYIIYEKIFHKEFETSLRHERANIFRRLAGTFLWSWMRFMENHFNFGFGLSIISVAKKMGDEHSAEIRSA